MKWFANPSQLRFPVLAATAFIVASMGVALRAEPPADMRPPSPKTPESAQPFSSPAGFNPNHRITDAGRRSYWAHTFSSGAHSVAVHGGDVYAVWYDVRNGDSDAFFAKSADGGMTFGPNVRVNDDTGKARQYKPSLGLDAAGGIYIIWRDDRRGHADIFFARSGDGGKTFSKNRLLNDDTGWAYQGNPAIGVSPEGNVYAAWSDDRNGQGDIYFTASRDRGRTFDRNLRLNDDAGRSVQSHPTVGAGAGGLVVVAWEDFRNGRSEVYLSRSTDGGKTFEPNRRVVSGADGTVRVSPSIAVAPNGRVALAWSQFKPQSVQLDPPDAAKGETLWWEKVRQGDADIYLAVSTDGGAHFGPPVQVNDDSSGKAQAFPSVAMDDSGGVYLAWEDFREGQPNIYYSAMPHPESTVGFVPNQKVNEDTGPARRSHPSLAVDTNGRPYFLWTDGRGNPFASSPGADDGTEEEGNDVFFTTTR
ncbi:MAG: exo-alpha-sialidase [Nitrospirae bacterium]|nr:exo-alpha-sialidase [Nitrospirota bacterium]